MSLEFEARYFLEHKALPHTFYNEGTRLLSALILRKEAGVRGFYDRVVAANPDYTCPYCDSDFSVEYKKYFDDVRYLVLRVGMPEPEERLLCRAVYFVFGEHGSYEQYITSELTAEGNYFLCTWFENGTHLVLDVAPDDSQDEMDAVASLFEEMKNNADIKAAQSICGSKNGLYS